MIELVATMNDNILGIRARVAEIQEKGYRYTTMLLLKAAQTEDNLAEKFLHLARQKQRELAVL